MLFLGGCRFRRCWTGTDVGLEDVALGGMQLWKMLPWGWGDAGLGPDAHPEDAGSEGGVALEGCCFGKDADLGRVCAGFGMMLV